MNEPGGTLILALLIYALWRKRKGATCSEIVCFKRHPGTIALSSRPLRDERLTALSIYQESRYSVRSYKIGSTFSFGKAIKQPFVVPSNVAERFHKQNPWMQCVWKTTNSPTPTTEAHPIAQVTVAPSTQLRLPEMARVYIGHGPKRRMIQDSSRDIANQVLLSRLEKDRLSKAN